jgi:RHS repeat-associated protein
VYFIETDHLNTPRRITDPANQVVWQWQNNDPFGNNVPVSTAGFEFNLRFPGQYFDKETNLHYNYFRDYDPATGRYIQSDPIGLQGGINTYDYVEGNPVAFSDSLGLWRLPDYGTLGVPVLGPVGVSVTVDRAGNVYLGLGIGASPRGGLGLSVGWTGDKCTPDSKPLEKFLEGWGANAGAGIGATWSDPTGPRNDDPSRLGLNFQTPGAGVGYNFGLGNLGNIGK